MRKVPGCGCEKIRQAGQKSPCMPNFDGYIPRSPPGGTWRNSEMGGRSSGVEHNLAKVGVEGSNPFARSIFRI